VISVDCEVPKIRKAFVKFFNVSRNLLTKKPYALEGVKQGKGKSPKYFNHEK
jgi:hypothetical protein